MSNEDWREFHACLTGDCPHDSQIQCNAELASFWRECYQTLIAQSKRDEELIAELVKAIRAVLEDGVQETISRYLMSKNSKNSKNSKGHYGNFGFEGCEAYIEEHLQPVFHKANKRLKGKE